MTAPDETPPLATYLEPELGPARMARNRTAIERKLAEGWASRHRAALGAVAAIAAVVGIAISVQRGSAPTGPEAGATLAVWTVSPEARLAATSAPSTVGLDDGSTIELDAHSAVRGVARSEAELTLELEHGGALFDVAHVEGRTFAVRSGDVTVRVLGTRFSVGRDGGRVSVRVERGRVEVRRGDEEPVILTASESWTGEERVAVAPPVLEVPAEIAVLETAGLEPAGLETAGLETAGVEAAGPATTAHERDGARRAEGAGEESARALFDAARAARREGRPDRAAVLFAELIEQHPRDARAGLAAFELGRIRADVLHEDRAAITALERALVLSPSGSFREDALARLVVLYDREGDRERCRRAQRRYLDGFPDGAHASEVGRRCE